MPHTYIASYAHVIFSTKERRRVITPDLQQSLWPYIGGIARAHDMRALCVGGVEDHLYVLLSQNGTLGLSKVVQLLKGNSSKWINDALKGRRDFAWQEGFGAFSIGQSPLERTAQYIQGQAEHHRRVSFEEEFVTFLKRYGVQYDPRYVFG